MTKNISEIFKEKLSVEEEAEQIIELYGSGLKIKVRELEIRLDAMRKDAGEEPSERFLRDQELIEILKKKINNSSSS